MYRWSSQSVATATNMMPTISSTNVSATCGAVHKIHAIDATTSCDKNNNVIKENKEDLEKKLEKQNSKYFLK